MCTDELKRFSCFQIMTDLKVIGAGLGRTGTKSLQQALVLLGFGPCHHMTELLPDNQEHLWPMWKEIFSSSEDKSEKLKEAFRGYVAILRITLAVYFIKSSFSGILMLK